MVDNNVEEPLINEAAQDFNNPPLRRMRTSLVNRRQMEAIAQQDVVRNQTKQHLKDCVYRILYITYLCVCYFKPSIFGLERDEECTMNCSFYNAMFGMVLIGIPLIVRIFFLLGMCCKRTVVAR